MLKRFLLVFLVLALVIAIVSIIGCGGTTNEGGATSTAKVMTLSSFSSGNRVVTYGGARSSGVSAQSSNVTGTVYNSSDNSALANVTVWAGTTIIATTGADGTYTLSNVPSGDVVFTALAPQTSGYLFSGLSVKTQASKIDFYILYVNGTEVYEYGTVTGEVTDSSGSAVTYPTIAFTTRLSNVPYPAFYAGTGDSSGSYIVSSILAGSQGIAAGKIGTGNGYVSSAALESNASLEVDVQIPAQGTISGSFTLPAGITSGSLSYCPARIAIADNQGLRLATYEATSSTYNVSVPANTECFIDLGWWATDGTKGLVVADWDISVGEGETLEKNYTFYAVPSNIILSTSEEGGTTTSNLSWEAPSGWTPDIYYLWNNISYAGGIMYWGMFTDETSVTVPVELGAVRVNAIETIGTVDIDSLDVFEIKYQHVSQRANL